MDTIGTIHACSRSLRPVATLTIILVASMLAACGLSVESLVPDLSGQHYVPSKLTLRILPVSDTPIFNRGMGAVSGEMMRDAVVLALGKANLFSAVVTDSTADLTLQIDLIQQLDVVQRSLSRWEHRREVIVAYELVEPATKQIVWKDTIRTVAGSTAIGGNAAVTESSEGAVRENIKALVLAAGDQWPRNARKTGER